jgi:hypothetical protein
MPRKGALLLLLSRPESASLTMIVAPPPPSGKPVAFYDTECYPNYWLLKFRPQGGEVYSFALLAGERLDSTSIARIRRLFDLFTVVSFNGIYYDVPMITAALSCYSTEQLKWLNDEIIGGKKPWELGLPEWKPVDHIDVMEVLPGKGSQKAYAGRIHCKTMRDLPYSPSQYLTPTEILEVESYCENDLSVLEDLFVAVAPQLEIRVDLGERYGLDLRSKSDAQCAEAILKRRCEHALGQRIYKPEVDWNLAFRYEPPSFLAFSTPQMQHAFEMVKTSVFTLGASGAVVMPAQLSGLEIAIGSSVYRMGIGGLHSSEKSRAIYSTETHVLRDADVASYYPSLMLNSGKYPKALGPAFLTEFGGLKGERLEDKKLQKKLEKAGLKYTPEWAKAYNGNEGKKVFVNGTFGKTLSHYSVLFGPEMGIQTTVTGQLSLLMLIEWMEHYGIPVVSANTDGIVINCPRTHIATADALIEGWERRTGLEMDKPLGEYAAIYSRDINAYIGIKSDGEVKRKGAGLAQASLVGKTSPDTEICGDAVTEFLSKGTPMLYTVAACRDIRKFVTIQKVAGGAVKMWGVGPRKETKVVEMPPTLLANGWTKAGRKWERDGVVTDARSAYCSCFAPQLPEYLGKVIRWFYSHQAPGPIVYSDSGNTVGLSYGAKPCMTLPDEFPVDIDYDWYLDNCERILRDIGYTPVVQKKVA